MYAGVALLLGVNAAPTTAAAMGLCLSTSTPTMSLSASPSAPAEGATATVTCQATGGTVRSLSVTVSAGTLASGGTTGTIAGASGQLAWTLPATAGTYTVQCDAVPGSCTSAATTGPVPVTVGATAGAPTVSPVSGAGEVITSGTARFSVAATDPNSPPLPLTYVWSASGGTITPDPNDPTAATWQAPAAVGAYTVTATVSNGLLSKQSTAKVAVALAPYQARLAVPVRAPRRIAASQDGLGGVYVIDGRQGTVGRVELLTVKGELRGTVTLPEPALAVAQGGGALWVTTIPGNVFRVDSSTGRPSGPLPLDRGPLLKPLGLAWDSSHSTLWVVESAAGRVRVIRPDGSTVAVIPSAGAVALGTPVDVGVDPVRGRAWVLDADSNAAGYHLHAYGLDGAYAASFLTDGELGRGGGLAVGPDGRVYVSDAYQGVVNVRDPSGAGLGTIGVFGDAAGQLVAPAGVAVLSNGDVAVTSPTNATVERFGNGTALPRACTAGSQLDSDCDGLPDAWELARGLNPYFAGDALLAYGRAGMSNYDLYAYHTQYGTDPWAPPVATVSVPSRARPGVVKLFAALSAPPLVDVGCMWRQVSGPSVALSGARGSSPTFIARAAGVYTFEVIPATSLATGAPVQAVVTVANLPPVAEPGRLVVAAPGRKVRLDGAFSSDANGDALAYAWDQSLGPAVTGASTGASLTVPVRRPGLYRFMLTATDAKGAASSAEVPVLVSAAPIATAVASASPAGPQAGDTVSLDGTASLFADASPTFEWQQVAGPHVTLARPAGPVATFVPAAAGHYAFALTISGRGGQRSPPATVDVFVAEPGRPLPAIQAASTPSGVVAVNTAVSLEASGTGTGYAWKQVAGPAAGLTDADLATATVVPFSPGFHAFEVSAIDGEAVSPPVRVTFEARAGGKPIPVARISVPGLAPVAGQLVFLDGRASTRATRGRWTQVAGPWVVLGGQAAVTSFRPHDPGTYAFELEVDDGVVRSAPARVELVVTDGEVK